MPLILVKQQCKVKARDTVHSHTLEVGLAPGLGANLLFCAQIWRLRLVDRNVTAETNMQMLILNNYKGKQSNTPMNVVKLKL